MKPPSVNRISCTVRQATEATGLSTRKVWSMIGTGELASVKVGKRRLIVWESLIRVATAGTRQDAPGTTISSGNAIPHSKTESR